MSKKPYSQELEDRRNRGLLIILTGPTAVGKDTVMRALLQKRKNLVQMVTTNSRPIRTEEKQGVDYHFVSRVEFEELLAKDAFIEWVEYLGHYKGGQKQHLEDALASGKDVIWRIDVRGVKNIKSKVKEMARDKNSPVEAAVFVFLGAPDLETLKRRMQVRGSENKDVWEEGLNLAKWELEQYDDCDYLVVNKDDKLDHTIETVENIIEAAHRRIS